MKDKKHSVRATTVVTYAVLGAMAGTSFLLPNQLCTRTAEAAGPPVVRVPGVVRDFTSSHPDFGSLSASAGPGHYAGSVGLSLPLDPRPALVNGGFKVQTQWTDQGGNEIAPHMYRTASAGEIFMVNPPGIDKDAFFDSWDPSKGPYGGGNVGPVPSINTGATMPTVTVPTLGPNVGDVLYAGVAVISGDVHCNDFGNNAGTTIIIDGKVRIVCERDFTLEKNSTISLNAGATLDIYVADRATIAQGSSINMNTWDPSLCNFYALSKNFTFMINQNSSFCGNIIAPQTTVHLAQNDHIYGSVTAEDLQLDQTTGLHVPVAAPRDACGLAINDVAGSPSGAGTGAITSAATFDEWFRDVPGVNQSTIHSIPMTLDAFGVYEYLDSDFHPVDGMLLGNQGQARNEYFTFALRLSFVYSSCAGQFVSFQGGDGMWLFIDGQLVMDIGGVNPMDDQQIDLDRLGLVDGGSYEMQLFYAERDAFDPVFNFRTNVPLVPQTYPAVVSAMGD